MQIDLTLKALANDHRRQILFWLKDPAAHFPAPLPEHAHLPGVCTGYLPDKSGLSAPTVSQYLGLLEQAGLVTRHRHGRWVFVTRNEDGIAAALSALEDLIGAP